MVTNPVWQAELSRNAGKNSQSAIAWELCSRVAAAGREDCVIAGVDNLANFDQLKADRQKAFCAEVTGRLKDKCYERIGLNLRSRTQDEPTLRSSCARLGANARLCLRGAGVAA
jgi:hypothetical protein